MPTSSALHFDQRRSGLRSARSPHLRARMVGRIAAQLSMPRVALRVMRLFVGILSVLVAVSACCLIPASRANAGPVRSRGNDPCAPRGARVLLASPQAQIFAARERQTQVTAIRGCANGGRRSFPVAGCSVSESASACIRNSHVTLAGTVVACQEAFVVDSNGVEPGVGEWYVAVSDLSTGYLVRRVPTGTRLHPQAHYIGVGTS